MCMTLRAPCLRRTFSGRGSSKSLHSADCRFVSRSQEYTQVSSPQILGLPVRPSVAVRQPRLFRLEAFLTEGDHKYSIASKLFPSLRCAVSLGMIGEQKVLSVSNIHQNDR
ncbi:hypothetical protein RRG08_017903 [Elysia crispata]|uniref:Uncharacterized protein n=1 Tax=Elysia crispata TaxID=231223 RepID=A0AAE1AAK0_9GAST|nr:hypothetical protein RRG08_017903 [Elysia crispata]